MQLFCRKHKHRTQINSQKRILQHVHISQAINHFYLVSSIRDYQTRVTPLSSDIGINTQVQKGSYFGVTITTKYARLSTRNLALQQCHKLSFHYNNLELLQIIKDHPSIHALVNNTLFELQLLIETTSSMRHKNVSDK